MSFIWPWFTLLLLLIPLLIAIYVWILRRKRKFAVRYSSLSLIRAALPKHSRWRQHLPFILFLLSLLCLTTAVARPVAAVRVPLNRTTVILAIDVSGSMCATDVDPNRLAVAQQAALDFIEDQADDTRIGIVAFARFAEIVVPPTNDKDELKQAIRNLTTSMGTAIGSATLKSIDAISGVNQAVAPSGVNLGTQADETPPDEGFYQPDIIVVLTDGANTHGTLPLDAAQQAAGRQVRIYTIGFGSDNPGQLVCSPQQLGSNAFGGRFGRGFGRGFGGGGRRRNFLVLDEQTLMGMADITGGVYYRAEDADQLYDVFVNLPSEIVLQKERLEISAIFSMLGAVFATIAVALALVWHRFP
jgi:Ca-activated chloride channel family protein